MPELIERCRPRTWDEFVGQDKAIAQLRRYVERPGFDGGSFLIAGLSGGGKTSAAWLLARQFAAQDCDIMELDGEACTVDAVREVADLMRYRALAGGFRVWILNEAQSMTTKAVQAWLTTLEKRPPRVLFIFTTTTEPDTLFGEFASPFASRCKLVEFSNQALAEPFARRAVEIAEREGLTSLNGETYKAALKLVRDKRNNFRAVLQAIDFGALLAT